MEEPVSLRALPLLSLFISCYFTSACASEEYQLQLDNNLAKCVNIQPGRFENYLNVTLYRTNFDIKKSIGYCGCKSALATVIVTRDQAEVSRYSFAMLSSRELAIPVEVDNTLTKRKVGSYQISLNCGEY